MGAKEEVPTPQYCLGLELRRLRLQKKFSVINVARQLGRSQSFLSNVEVGRYLPGAEVLLDVAKLYAVEPGPLLEMLRMDLVNAHLFRLEQEHDELLRGSQKASRKRRSPEQAGQRSSREEAPAPPMPLQPQSAFPFANGK